MKHLRIRGRRYCLQCWREFKFTSKRQVYCSSRCRVAAFRQRRQQAYEAMMAEVAQAQAYQSEADNLEVIL